LKRIQQLYNEYPYSFWVLILGTFIDRIGRAILFPFFTLYITRKFAVGMTEVGLVFGLFSISNVVGSMIGGALTDRLGRKGMILFGLVASGLSSLLMGQIEVFELFFGFTVVTGLFANAGGPAQQAMVADMLAEEKRAEGFGVLRVVINLADTMGPMVGGLLASQSYLFLFIGDAVVSVIAAVIVYLRLQETRPVSDKEVPEESVAQAFGGYLKVVKDTVFVWFLGAFMLMVVVYMQMHTTLAVYLRDVHGIAEKGFGYMMSLNAALVVLFQIPITRRIKEYRPLVVMIAGTLLYAAGFGMVGIVSTYALFLVAIVVITAGEMLVSPVGQAIAARLSPEEMRGRYMAVFGFSWVIPTAVGPFLAGLVMDNFNPAWVWYCAGILALVSAGGYYLLLAGVKMGTRLQPGSDDAG
jgi:MFS family permease